MSNYIMKHKQVTFEGSIKKGQEKELTRYYNIVNDKHSNKQLKRDAKQHIDSLNSILSHSF